MLPDEGLAEVLQAAAAGQHPARRALWEECSPGVAGYARLLGAADPEDAASEVFLAVCEALPRFHGDEAGFRALVYATARQRLVGEPRRPSVRPVEVAWLPESAARPVPRAEELVPPRLGSDEVTAWMGRLAPGQREVLVLRLLGGLTLAQVAAVLGQQPDEVRDLQGRALEELWRQVEPPGQRAPGVDGVAGRGGRQLSEPDVEGLVRAARSRGRTVPVAEPVAPTGGADQVSAIELAINRALGRVDPPAEQLAAGDPVDPEPAPATDGDAFVGRTDLAPLLRLLSDIHDSLNPGSVTPSPELASLLTDTPVAAEPTPLARRGTRRVAAVLAAGLGVKLAVGATAAAAAVAGAGVVGVLPQPVQQVVDRVLRPTADREQPVVDDGAARPGRSRRDRDRARDRGRPGGTDEERTRPGRSAGKDRGRGDRPVVPVGKPSGSPGNGNAHGNGNAGNAHGNGNGNGNAGNGNAGNGHGSGNRNGTAGNGSAGNGHGSGNRNGTAGNGSAGNGHGDGKANGNAGTGGSAAGLRHGTRAAAGVSRRTSARPEALPRNRLPQSSVVAATASSGLVVSTVSM